MSKYFNCKLLFMALLLFFIPFNYSEVKAADYSSISYGIVNFKTKACNANTSYIEYPTGRTGYTNGCYGADGAFLGMYNGKVKFMLSGVIGLVDPSEVTVIDIPKYDASTYISSYRVKDGSLQHCVSLDTTHSSFNCYSLGKNTIGLKNDVYYLSYDGHYFYEYTIANFKKMIDDYKNNVRTNAFNSSPYYNYYQFVTHRTKTNQTAADYNSHIKTMTSNTGSKMYNLGTSFIDSQNIYGANGSLVYSVAGNESDWGTSSYAMNRNNLFGHSAYDSNPDSAGSYKTPAESVMAHSKSFISEGFLDPCDWSNTYGNGYDANICLQGRYNGGNLGNKASGINVRYASDPFWGEKAASNYYNLESKTGTSDYGYYTLGIKTSYDIFNIRKEPNSNSTVLYQTTPTVDYPFVILGKVIGSDNKVWYKIQTDPTLDSTRSKLIQDKGEYNFNNNYGYVSSEAVNIYLAGSKIIEDSTNITYNITFNANGGLFSDNTATKVVNVKKGVKPTVTNPTKEGFVFAGWSPAIEVASKAITYKAIWNAKEYNITFNTNGGTFSDKTTSKVVKVKYNELPKVEQPTKEGFIFNEWSPKISKVTKATIYTATWIKEEITDDDLIKKDGEFYLNSFNWNEKTNQYDISGYQIILNSSNKIADKINYWVVAHNLNTDEDYEIAVDRWTTDVPFNLGYENGFDYNGSWFKSKVSFKDLPAGDYKLYMKAVNDKYYSKSLITNLFNKDIKRRGIDEVKGYSLTVDLKSKDQNIMLSVRDGKLITVSESPTYRNMINNYDDISFTTDKKLHVIGTSYNYGANYSKAGDIERNLIIENNETFERYEYNIGSTNKGSYTVTSNDKLSKAYAWYNKSIDVSKLPIGKYSLIVKTKAGNIEDYGEISDIFGNINEVKLGIDGKNYQIILNKKRNNRIELHVT